MYRHKTLECKRLGRERDPNRTAHGEMKTESIHAARALTPAGWQLDVRLTFADGRLGVVTSGVAPAAGDECHAIVLPAMPNLHSHAFQRGMAGLAERRAASADNFWSWREAMYRFAHAMTPAQVEAVAAQVYVEMLEAGFCRVGEFHYLHHDIDGGVYGDIAEMAARIAAAAGETGIGLTLLPVFYAHARFGGAAPLEGQRRFINDVDRYARLLDGCRAAVKPLGTAIVGVAPHSLRAVTPDELTAVAGLAGGAPIHIHIAEQVKEVDDCIAWSGQRPVEWLLDHAAVDDRWCLVHATHMTQAETARTAGSRAVAGLCPITEANLGDGVFNGPAFIERGGRFGIGSDSNVQIGAADELRLLEYSQRLVLRARNVMTTEVGSTGRRLFDAAIAGGAQALGVATGLAPGGPCDLLSLNAKHPALAGRTADDVLDAWIFSGGNSLIDCVWIAGRKVVEEGRHYRRAEIAAKFSEVMMKLCAA